MSCSYETSNTLEDMLYDSNATQDPTLSSAPNVQWSSLVTGPPPPLMGDDVEWDAPASSPFGNVETNRATTQTNKFDDGEQHVYTTAPPPLLEGAGELFPFDALSIDPQSLAVDMDEQQHFLDIAPEEQPVKKMKETHQPPHPKSPSASDANPIIASFPSVDSTPPPAPETSVVANKSPASTTTKKKSTRKRRLSATKTNAKTPQMKQKRDRTASAEFCAAKLPPHEIYIPDKESPLDLSREDLLKLNSTSLEEYTRQLCARRKLSTEEQKQLKKHRRLIKNRESAQLSRLRKRMYVHELESRIDSLTHENDQLIQSNTHLHEENTQLKSRVAELERQLGSPSRTSRNHSSSSSSSSSSNKTKSAVCLLAVLFSFGLFFNMQQQQQDQQVAIGMATSGSYEFPADTQQLAWSSSGASSSSPSGRNLLAFEQQLQEPSSSPSVHLLYDDQDSNAKRAFSTALATGNNIDGGLAKKQKTLHIDDIFEEQAPAPLISLKPAPVAKPFFYCPDPLQLEHQEKMTDDTLLSSSLVLVNEQSANASDQVDTAATDESILSLLIPSEAVNGTLIHMEPEATNSLLEVKCKVMDVHIWQGGSTFNAVRRQTI